MAISSRHLGWLERLAPRLFIDGRFCPIRAYRTRTVRGPVDRTLVVLVLAVIGGRFCPLRAWRTRRRGGPVDKALLVIVGLVIGLGVYRATVFYLSGH